MASLNKVMLIGNVGADPEMRQAGAQPVCNFRIATNEKFGGKDGAPKQERTEWHSIVAWGRLGEVCAEYLRKGSPCYIEGRLQTREWEKDGQKRYTTEIVASSMVMLGGRDENKGEPYRAPVAQSSAGMTFDDDDKPLPF